VKRVTTPKLPPPPRSAQNRSAFWCSSRGHHATVGGDHLGCEQVVAGQAVAAGEVADPAAQGEPADAGGRDDPAGRGQPERGGGVVEPAPRRPAAGGRRPRGRVDVHRLHRREVDDDGVVRGAEAGHAVPAAPDRHGPAGLRGVRTAATTSSVPAQRTTRADGPRSWRCRRAAPPRSPVLGPDQLALDAIGECPWQLRAHGFSSVRMATDARSPPGTAHDQKCLTSGPRRMVTSGHRQPRGAV
jgi:hypothetical protein